MTDNLRNFGFPRWGGYGREQNADTVRMCDYQGCAERGDHPAPKSPHSKERWHFCKDHASEYNRNWNFFDGMTDSEAKAYEASSSSSGFSKAQTFEWGGAVDESGYSSSEQTAFDVLELDIGAEQTAIKSQYRKLAKMYHPDANRNDSQAAKRFHEIQAAYDLLANRSEKTVF